MKIKTKDALPRLLGGVRFIPRFKPAAHPRYEAFRALLHGLRIKFLLLCGYGVVVVGRCRSGKTYLLEKALPGRVVGPDMEIVLAGRRGAFDLAKIPEGMFAIDEPTNFEWSDLLRSFPALQSRQVVFAVQGLTHLVRLRLDELFEKRLVIVYLGTRDEYLQELARAGAAVDAGKSTVEAE